MKKIIIALSCIVIISVCILNYQCQETFIEVNQTNNKEVVTAGQRKDESLGKNENDSHPYKKSYVNIVIMNDGYRSIYHKNINIKSKNLNLYYGKNFRNKINGKKVSLDENSKYFKDNKVLKISTKDRMRFVGHNLEHNSPTYADTFYVYKTGSGLVLVNHVELEEYIARVISSEIGEDAPLEALKAQAVCARTYILKLKEKDYKKYNAIANDSTDFQVYNRISPGKKCYQAAKDTEGIVMAHKNKLINAYYFSTSCGYTTNYKIWGKEKKLYLRGENITKEKEKDIREQKVFEKFIKSCTKAYESSCPFYRWETSMTSQQIINAVYHLTGSNIGTIKKIEVNGRGEGGIASQITLYGNKKQIIIKKQNDIRKALCSIYAKIRLQNGEVRTGMEMLPSAFIHIEKAGDNYKIYGGGFGHGSGMSQNAAIEMAKEKMTYDNILKKFYNNVELINH